MSSKKHLLLSAVAGAVLLHSGAALAQSATTEAAPYYRADGTRTANYEEALESWRTDAQFAVDYSKRFLGLEHAYARGLTGRGTSIALVDTGVYWDHPLFAGRQNGLDLGGPTVPGDRGAIAAGTPWATHGTHTAGSAAGRRVAGQPMFGAAYGADIYTATVRQTTDDVPLLLDILNGAQRPTFDQALNRTIRENGSRILSNSWFVSAVNLRYDENEETIRNNILTNETLINEFPWQNIVENDRLVVFAAGNTRDIHAHFHASLPVALPQLRDHFLSVVNYTADGTAYEGTGTSGTNHCGLTATWCVAGPGTNIVSSVSSFEFDIDAFRQRYTVADWRQLQQGNAILRNINENNTSEQFTAYAGALLAVHLYQLLIAPFTGANPQTLVDNFANNLARSLNLYVAGADNTQEAVALAVTLVGTFSTIYTGSRGSDLGTRFTQTLSDAVLNELRPHIGNTTSSQKALTGTSMATPNIAGLAALLVEYFPEYNTGLINDILLSSSRDLDGASVDIRSGWGVPQMGTALEGPSALRAVREVRVSPGTVDVWSNNITNAIDRYSPLVLERNPNDIGGLIKVGGGELRLTGTNTYSGETRVRQGLLTVDGSLTRSALTVEDVGIVSGTGRLASLIAARGGVVSPGNAANPFGTLTVTGNARFEPGSFLWIKSKVNGTANSYLTVEGSTTLTGGKVILKADDGNWNLRTRGMRILNSAGGVTGRFEGAISDLGFLDPLLTYEKNVVRLQLIRNDVTVASAGATSNDRRAGAAIDHMLVANTTGNLQLEDAILDGSYAAVKAGLASLTGEVHASLGGFNTANARHLREAVLDRGRTMPSIGAIEQDLNNRGVTAWATGYISDGQFDGTESYRRYRHETDGYAVGIEKRFNDHTFIGVTAGQSDGEIKINKLNSTGKSSLTQYGGYLGTNLAGLGLRAGATRLDGDFSTTRFAALNAFANRLNADYDGKGWQAWGEASLAARAGSTIFEPYVNYTRHSFAATLAEKGGDAALGGRVRHKSHLVSGGLRTDTHLAGEPGRPQLNLLAHVGYSHDLNQQGLRYRAHFNDGPKFAIKAPRPLDGGITTALGVKLRATETLSVDLGYTGLHRSDYSDTRAHVRLNLEF